ncbi:MAG: protein kinase [Pseudanabaenaceae cyanobacterium bins.68]|nr:protein kinase [Pseudanabaenaceae cyanobacterium bins.68]
MSTLNFVANPDRLIGRYVDSKYLIEALVSNGLFSRIYRASCGDRVIAFKILHLDCTSDPELGEQFLRQMQLVACVQTKKVLRVFDYGIDFFPLEVLGSDRQLPYIVSEFCDFPNLTERTYDPIAATRLILEIIKSLQSLYAGAYLRSESGSIIRPLQFWHHNLKPSNVFIGDLYPLLADYGGYQLLAFPDLDWQYAAPEDWQADLPRDQRRDVYGCGLILYEILTGQPAYQPQDGMRAWQQAIAHQPISGFSPQLNIPRELELITLRCLEKHPQHRYQNLKELQLALEQFSQIPSTAVLAPKRSRQIAPVLASAALIPLALVTLTQLQPRPTPLANPNLPTPPQPLALARPQPQPVAPLRRIRAFQPALKISRPNRQNTAQIIERSQPREVEPNIPPQAPVKVLPPIAKRPAPIPAPLPLLPPPPLPQPQTKLIPPPSIFELQDGSTIRLLLPVSDQQKNNFTGLIDRSAELAGRSITQAFGLNPQRQEVEIAIIGSRNGAEVPLLLAKVSRSQWQSDPNINRWANYILKAESLLQ